MKTNIILQGDCIEKLKELPENSVDAIITDPFLGSGTTAIACLKQGRQFIGIEKEEEYIKIATKRLKPHLEQTKLK